MIQEGTTQGLISSDFNLKTLVYGAPGTGKTWFGGTHPKPYFVAKDRNLLGLAAAGKDIDYVFIDTYEDAVSVLEQIYNGQRAKNARSIIFDNITFMTDAIVRTVKEKHGKGSKVNATGMNRELWGVASDYLKELIHQLLKLSDKFHLCVIAHEQIEKEELTGGVYGNPSTIGKMAYHIGGYFDLFLYARQNVVWDNGKQVKTYKMNTVKFGSFNAKDLIGVLDPEEPNDFTVIYDKVKGKLTK